MALFFGPKSISQWPGNLSAVRSLAPSRFARSGRRRTAENVLDRAQLV
jgi:hypothetical protein